MSAAPAQSASVTAKPASAKGKGKAKASIKAPAKKAATKSAPVKAHPSWKEIITECITANSADSRSGVSRSTIKKFAENQYKIEMNGLANSQMNRAITSGAFHLPKGPSGKVKLPPKHRSDPAKENARPPTATKKVVPAKKPAATTKVASEKKPVAKKPTIAMPKKTKTVAKTPTKKTSSAKTPAKKVAAKAAASKPKTKAKKPASKPKARA